MQPCSREALRACKRAVAASTRIPDAARDREAAAFADVWGGAGNAGAVRKSAKGTRRPVAAT